MYERWLIDIPVFFIKTRTYIISKTCLHFGLSSANQLLTVTSMFSFGFYPVCTDHSFLFIVAQIIPAYIHVMSLSETSLSSWYEWNFFFFDSVWVKLHGKHYNAPSFTYKQHIRNLVQKAPTRPHVAKTCHKKKTCDAGAATKWWNQRLIALACMITMDLYIRTFLPYQKT